MKIEMKDYLELRKNKVVVDYLRENLIKSNLPIGSVSYVMSLLNYVEDDECTNDSYFYSKHLINEELKRVLEMI